METQLTPSCGEKQRAVVAHRDRAVTGRPSEGRPSGTWRRSIRLLEQESGRASLVLPERQKSEITNAGTRWVGLIQTAFDVCACVK